MNVVGLLRAASERQDALRGADNDHLHELIRVRAEIAAMRENHHRELRVAEAQRIDAIRAVDVGAVNRAAEVAATQATTLANQVAVSAEALRNQVSAAATAATIALASALEPIQKDIADLRKAQYEAQGQKTQVIETRTGSGTNAAIIGTAAALIFGLISVAVAVVSLVSR